MTATMARRLARLEAGRPDAEQARIERMTDAELRNEIVEMCRVELSDPSLPMWRRTDALAEIAYYENEPARQIERERLQAMRGQLSDPEYNAAWLLFEEQETARTMVWRERMARAAAALRLANCGR
jgi:hypothetical protein